MWLGRVLDRVWDLSSWLLKIGRVFIDVAIGFYCVLCLRLRLIDCLSRGRVLKRIYLGEVIEGIGLGLLPDL